MKVLIIDKAAGVRNGVAVYNQRFTDFLIKNGHEVFILRWNKTKKQNEENITYLPYYLGSEKFQLVIIPHLKNINNINKTIKELKPDIVYITVLTSPLDLLLPYFCHKNKVKLAGTLHMDISKDNNLSQKLLKTYWCFVYAPFARHLDLLHVFSARTQNFFTKRGVKKEKITVIPNGINSSLYTPGESEFAKKHNISKGILLLGRLSLQKNPEVLIKSFLTINPGDNTKLVIVGTGELYKKLIDKYKDERIIFTGFIDEEKERIDIIRSCQIFALPSRGEGLSLSLLETMSCALTPIVSDVGSSRDVVSDTGTVIKLNYLESELPIVLKKYLDNFESTKSLGLKARERIINNYVEKENFQKLLDDFKRTSD